MLKKRVFKRIFYFFLLICLNQTEISIGKKVPVWPKILNDKEIELFVNGSDLMILHLKSVDKSLIRDQAVLQEIGNKYKYKMKCHLFSGHVNQDEEFSLVSVSLCQNEINGFIYINKTLLTIESDYKKQHYLANTKKQLEIDKRRNRRSVESKERLVKVLLVADYSMHLKFSDQQHLSLEFYLLTIMNMVTFLYRDASLGNRIQFNIVRLILFNEKEDQTFQVVNDAQITLENFCKYQNEINPPEPHSNHHDLAILVTDVDLCKSQSNSSLANGTTDLAKSNCDTLGLAGLGGICNPLKSCTINEDSGLSLALTIAHEIGHTFNAEHDNDEEEKKCSNSLINRPKIIKNDEDEEKKKKQPFLMNTHLTTFSSDLIWSECSRLEITEFLDRNELSCLNDVDQVSLTSSQIDQVPGIYYDFDHQCRFAFGPNATHCNKDQRNECSVVWCKINNGTTSGTTNNLCHTNNDRAAEGTLCGRDRQKNWCIRGQCVPIEESSSTPIDGEWSQWSKWSPCSRACSVGIQSQERKCSNPEPRNHGLYCVGQRKRHRLCNRQKCDTEASQELNRKQEHIYNNEQCSRLNSNRTVWTWYPFGFDSSCKLYCSRMNQNQFNGTYFKFSGFYAQDGTRCDEGQNNDNGGVCILGVCRSAGCDWVLESNKVDDSCGVCDGDNSTCDLINGIIDSFNQTRGYQTLFILPQGARSILIRQETNSSGSNYLALKNQNDSKFYLNGQYSISASGNFLIQDTKFNYRIDSVQQKWNEIKSKGPIVQPMQVLLLYLNNRSKTTFEYTIPKPRSLWPRRHFIYFWHHVDDQWSLCNVTCGHGYSQQLLNCIRQQLDINSTVLNPKMEIVDDLHCLIAKQPRPLMKQKECNAHLCPSHWWIGQWQECSADCRLNNGKGFRKRSVICVLEDNDKKIMARPEIECQNEKRPRSIEACIIKGHLCSHIESNGHWHVASDWSSECDLDACSVQTRIVICSGGLNAICDPNKRPLSERRCNETIKDKKIICGQWSVSAWSPCFAYCYDWIRKEIGFRTRRVQCVNGDKCRKSNEPHIMEACSSPIPCPLTSTTTTKSSTTQQMQMAIIAEIMFKMNDRKEDKQLYADLLIRFKERNKSHILNMLKKSLKNIEINGINERSLLKRELNEDNSSFLIESSNDFINNETEVFNDLETTQNENLKLNNSKIDIGKNNKSKLIDPIILFNDNIATSISTSTIDTNISINISNNIATHISTTTNTTSTTTTIDNTDNNFTNIDNNNKNEFMMELIDSYNDTIIVFNSNASSTATTTANTSFITATVINTNIESMVTDVIDNDIKGYDIELINNNGNDTVVQFTINNNNNISTINKTEELINDLIINETIINENKSNLIKEMNSTKIEKIENKINKSNELNLINETFNNNQTDSLIYNKLLIANLSSILLANNITMSLFNYNNSNNFTSEIIKFLLNQTTTTTTSPPSTTTSTTTRPIETFFWKSGPFGPCSRKCGIGFKVRKVICKSSLTYLQVGEKLCSNLTRLSSFEKCNTQKCSEWSIGEWGNCSTICDLGVQTREAQCPGGLDDLCDPWKYPITKQTCFIQPCNVWIAEEWSSCSISCRLTEQDEGFRTRRVYCHSYLTNRVSDSCNSILKPSTMSTCDEVLNQCQTTTIQTATKKCLDHFSKVICRLVFYSNRCFESDYLQEKCCETCNQYNSFL